MESSISIGTKIRFRSVIGTTHRATVDEIHGDLLIVRTSERYIVINREQII